MKSVGEAMAIGRTFKEAFQKGLRALETGRPGLDDRAARSHRRSARRRLGRGAARRAAPADAGAHLPGEARARARADRSTRSTSSPAIDPWFLGQMRELIEAEREYAALDDGRRATMLRRMKRMGFSDRQLGELRGETEDDVARASLGARRPAGVQDGRHLRRRVSVGDAVPLRQLRRGERSAAERTAIGRDPRQRPESHRAGRRVRLLLRARGDGAPRAGIRDDHDQLESGDRLDRLRHLGQAVLRAAHVRGRARDRASASSRRA